MAVRGTTRLGNLLGFDVAGHPIYSPIPTVPPPTDPIWSREVPGLEIDTEAQLRFVEDALSGHVAEFASEVRGHGFELWNGYYQAGDAEALYALLRHLKPRRVLEIGSGFSTYVSAAACVANAADGSPAELVAVDPRPRAELHDGIHGLERVERRDCRELPIERFRELEENDVLFIDSSHAVKLGSEVNWLFLEVLPELRPGVYVHVHDVFYRTSTRASSSSSARTSASSTSCMRSSSAMTTGRSCWRSARSPAVSPTGSPSRSGACARRFRGSPAFPTCPERSGCDVGVAAISRRAEPAG